MYVHSCDVFGYHATLHDNGVSPTKFKTGAFEIDKLRRELVAIHYVRASVYMCNVKKLIVYWQLWN